MQTKPSLVFIRFHPYPQEVESFIFNLLINALPFTF